MPCPAVPPRHSAPPRTRRRVPAAPHAPIRVKLRWIRQATHPSPRDNVGNQSLQPTGLSKITIKRQERNKGLEDLSLVWHRDVRMTVEHPSDQRGTRARCPKNEEWAPRHFLCGVLCSINEKRFRTEGAIRFPCFPAKLQPITSIYANLRQFVYINSFDSTPSD